MSLSREYYDLNGLKGKLFYHLHEFSFVLEHNIFKMRQLKPAFLDAIRANILSSDMVGVEIGVFRGKNAVSMLKHLSIKKLYLVDPYISFTIRNKKFKVNYNDLKYAGRLLKNYKDNVEWFLLPSDQAADLISDDLDFIHIDGNHNYDFVKRDVELYSKKLKPNGILCFDDTGLYSVSKVIIETIDGGGFEPVDGCINCLQKKVV